MRIERFNMRNLLLCAFSFVAALWVPAQAQITTTNTDEPIDITSETLDVFREKDYVVWQGDVQAIQGDAILTAPKLTTYGVLDGEVDRIVAVGGVRYTNITEAISGDTAEYVASKNTITFTGNVVAVQGEQVLSGGRLIYYLQTGELKFTAEKGKRVRGIFVNDEEQKSGS